MKEEGGGGGGLTCQFVNLINLPAYNSVSDFDSFSKYLVPSI